MKVLIVGLGSIARKHISALRALEPELEITALRSSAGYEEVEGIKSILKLPEPSSLQSYDFAIISNPTSLHAATIENLLESGLPLFIEKPLFDSLQHDELVERVVEKGTLTYIGCNLRFVDSLGFLKAYLSRHKERRINEVNSYCGSYMPEWRKGADYRKGYSARRELGGGVHLDLIHELDYICWLFGFPESSRGIWRNVSSLGIESYDYANYQLLYPGFTASVVLNYYRRVYKRTLEIVFEDDTWTLDFKTNKITDGKGEVVYEGKTGIPESYLRQMEYFLSHLKKNEKSENDISNAYQTLGIALKGELAK